MLASEGCGGHRRDLASPLAGAVTATTPTPPSTVNRTLARERRRSVAAVLVYIMPHSIGRPAVRTAGAVPMVDQNSDSFDSPNRPPFRRLNPHCVLWSPVPQVQNESPPPSAGTMAASPSTGAHGAVAAASRQTVTTLESTRDGLAVCPTAACRLRSPLLMPANRTQPPVWAHLPFSLCVSGHRPMMTAASLDWHLPLGRQRHRCHCQPHWAVYFSSGMPSKCWQSSRVGASWRKSTPCLIGPVHFGLCVGLSGRFRDRRRLLYVGEGNQRV